MTSKTMTNKMNKASEMHETSETCEKKLNATSGCVCALKNCELERPSVQMPDRRHRASPTSVVAQEKEIMSGGRRM